MNVTELKHNNAIIIIHRPELAEEAQKKKERQIERALRQFGRAMQEAERKRK